MYNMFHILMGCIATSLITLAITPVVKKIAFFVGATDKPDKRRVNKIVMPSMGGLAIFISFFVSLFFIQNIEASIIPPLFVASLIIVVTGVIDDIKEISPKIKILGITISAIIIFFWADIGFNSITLPYIGYVEMGIFSLPLTIIWILGITNAVNLIDGLDGLASGVTMIGLTTMGIIGFFFLGTANIAIPLMIFTLIAAILGFFPYNFFPASIYLGDTGSLFLGFMVSTFSLYSLKNVTFFSLIIPLVILAIPITDTFYAILRRKLNKRPISEADKDHMHHRLMVLGLSHRQTVIFIYCIAMIFSILALLYPLSSFWGSVLITGLLLLGLEVFVEIIGLVGENNRPLVTLIKKWASKFIKKK